MSRDSSSPQTTLSGMPCPGLSTEAAKSSPPGSEKLWKLTPSPKSRERSALTEALKQLSVDGTTFSFSTFSWAVRPPGQDAGNQARKVRLSRIPQIKMGVLLEGSPVGKQVLVTWAFGVVQFG